MTNLIEEYLKSQDMRQYGSDVSVMPGENGNVISPGTFPGDIFGQNVEMTNQTSEQMQENITASQKNTDFGNVFVGGARDAIEGAGETISDIGNFIGLKIPPPRLPEVDKPEGAVNNIARGFVQFGVGMLASPVKGFSTAKNIIRGAFSDSYFNPEEGGFITFMRELGVGPEVLEIFDTRVGEDASAYERLKGRLGNAVEGAVLGGIVDTIRHIKQTPQLLEKARNSIIQAGKNAEARMAEGGVQLNTGMDPDPLIAGAGKLVSRAVGPGGQDYIGFYSKLTDEIKNLPDGTKGSFEQLRATLINKGAKDDELYWTGFDDFFEGRTDITKAEMLEFAEKNRIEVEEVVKTGTDADTQLTFGNQRNLTPQEAHGENHLEELAEEIFTDEEYKYNDPGNPGVTYPPSMDNARVDAEKEYYKDPIVRRTDTNTGLVIQGNDVYGYNLYENEEKSKSYKNALFSEQALDLNEIQIQAEQYARENDLIKFDNEVTRYSQYTEPGGENYREIVLTVPNLNRQISPSNEVSPSHFPDDEGYLLHIRTKDRYVRNPSDPLNQKKILYIEELQSDYAKKRDEFGLREGTDEYENAKKLLMDARKEANEIAEKFGLQNVPFPMGEYRPGNLETTDYIYERFRQTRTERGAEELGTYLTSIPPFEVMERLKELSRIDNTNKKLVNPDILEAPFVDSDNKWVQMSIKYMIKKAIDEGYDGIAWTSGDVQVARYPSAYRSDILKLDITLLEKGVNDPNKPIYMVNEASGPGYSTLMSPRAVSENEIKKMFSEELSNKIIADGKAQFDETLEASRNIIYNNPGGEFTRQGMHNQYDKILPSNSKEVVKKLDKSAKVEVLQVGGFTEGYYEDRLGIIFTDKMKNKANVSGQPLFTGPAVATAGGAGAMMANQEGASDVNTNN